MKVLLINGSPDGKGCIHTALTLAAEVLNREGVETEEEYKMLKDAGCDIIQGYYFSKPLPAEEFAALLKKELGGKN